MTDLERKCNEYREYKRLAEQVMYKDVQSVRLDSKLLQTAHPDIYAECSKKTVYKRFSVV